MVELCRLDELTDGEARRFDVEGHGIAVVRIGDDVYAIGDRCSHQDISLSEGLVDIDDCTIECWKHGSTFDLRTGKPETLPATRPVPVYEVSVTDGKLKSTKASCEQGVKDRPQLATGGRELVDRAASVGRVRNALEHAPRDEVAQPLRQHAAGNVEVRLEVVEAAHPVKGVADDQQGPALTYHLERAGQRAVLTLVVLAKHSPSVPIGFSHQTHACYRRVQ